MHKAIGVLFIVVAANVSGSDQTLNRFRIPLGTVFAIPVSGTSEASGKAQQLSIQTFSWGFTLRPVTLKAGRKVRMWVTSASGVHGVAIPALRLATGPVAKGTEQVIEFVVEEPGNYFFLCNVPCGRGHPTMQGFLVVVE